MVQYNECKVVGKSQNGNCCYSYSCSSPSSLGQRNYPFTIWHLWLKGVEGRNVLGKRSPSSTHRKSFSFKSSQCWRTSKWNHLHISCDELNVCVYCGPLHPQAASALFALPPFGKAAATEESSTSNSGIEMYYVHTLNYIAVVSYCVSYTLCFIRGQLWHFGVGAIKFKN